MSWGGGASDTTIGPAKIQNRKPFCAAGGAWPKECTAGENTPTGVTCREDSDCEFTGGTCQENAEPHFGNAAGVDGVNACATTPFSFSHTYTFNADDRDRTRTCESVPNFSLREFFRGRRCTVYESPRVQVTDWWGKISAVATYPGRIIAVESRR